jgi:hypothetical protein
MLDGHDAGHGLSPRGLATTRAIAEAVFSTEKGPPPGERLDWVIAELDDLLARAGGKSRFVFRLSLIAVSILAPLLLFTFVPLRSMPLERRTHALEKLERNRLGLSLLAVKALLCVVYYEHPDAAREIGFEGHCMLP